MARQHLTMGINIDARSSRLVQKHFQVLQIMTGNKDPRIAAGTKVHFRDFWLPVSIRVSRIKKSHALNTVFTRFKGQGDKTINTNVFFLDIGKGTLNKSINVFIFMIQDICMMKISSKTFEAIGDGFLKRTDIFIGFGKDADFGSLCCIVRFRCRPEGRFRKPGYILQLCTQFCRFLKGFRHTGADGDLIKVGIRNGREKVQRDHMVDINSHVLSLFTKSCRDTAQPFGCIDQKILKRCNFGAFPADTADGAAFAPCCFLALITKHIQILSFWATAHLFEWNGSSIDAFIVSGEASGIRCFNNIKKKHPHFFAGMS